MQFTVTLIAIAATVLGSWMAFPQARHLLRTRRVDGVSPVWIGVSTAINGWWIAYGLAAEVWVLLPVAIISLLLYATMAAAYVAAVGRPAWAGLAAGVVGLGMVPLPFLVLGGWTAAGIALGLGYGLQLLPAVVAACRSDALGGIAPGTWLTAWGEAALWLAYVVIVPDLALALAGAMGLTMASVILVRLAVTGHRPFAVVGRRAVAVS